MKKLLFLLFVVIMSSCNNADIQVKCPDKVTTTEILKLAEVDTTLYKKVYLDDTLYLVSNNEVKYSLWNSTGVVVELLIIVALLIFFLLVWYYLFKD